MRRVHRLIWLVVLSVLLVTSTTPASAREEFAIWGACGVITNENKIVRTYEGVAGIRRVYLTCGGPKYTDKPLWGYRHIQARHQRDFEVLAVRTAQNWRDIADVGMGGSLRDPEVRGPVIDGKRCFSRKIYYYNLETGKLVSTVIIKTIFRTTDNAIVTTYPSDEHCDGSRR